jgi:serine/threonine protein phosphatase PrpC
VKPDNILVAEDDFAYLIDFGIARTTDETRVTDTGVTVGSWAYVAPERFRRGYMGEPRADVYALACVLHQSLTGEPPFSCASLAELVTAHMFEPPPKPSQLRRGVPADMDHVIATGMAKEADHRYGTTKDLAQAARAALTTRPLDAEPHRHGTPRRTPRPVRLALRYAARNDRGLESLVNEDCVYAGARLLAVADGIGNPLGGHLASELMIGALAALDDEEPGDDMVTKLDAAIRAASTAIWTLAYHNSEYAGIATTLTAIWFGGNRFALAHIGGSRAYLLRDGGLTQITSDGITGIVGHARHSSERSPGRPTLTMREARAGDRYLLCTRGLSDPVDDKTIRQVLLISDIVECANTLVASALHRGGAENITVVIADVVDAGGHQDDTVVT